MIGRTKLLIAVVAATAAVLAIQVFVPPIAGIANQGDFYRTIGRFSYGPQSRGALNYSFVEPKYVPDAGYRARGWEQATSENLFVAAMLLVNKPISMSGVLDIRVAGLVHGLAFLAAFARLLWVAGRGRARPVLWLAAAVALTDIGYTQYWNSFYSEPAACIFFLLALAEGLDMAVRGRASRAAVIRWSVWACLLTLAKAQYAPLGLLFGLFAFRLGSRAWSEGARAVALLGGCAVLACAAYDAMAVPPGIGVANAYNMLFGAVLVESKSPAADLQALGLEPGLARYAGTGAWSAGSAFPEMVASGTIGKRVTVFTILRFYLLRPARIWRRLERHRGRLTRFRSDLTTEWYGNFEPSAGRPPNARGGRFNLWSAFHERLLTRISLWAVATLASWPLAALWMWARCPKGPRRLRIEAASLLPLACLASLAALFADGFDVVKHLYLFNLTLDACLFCAAAYCGDRLRNRRFPGRRIS